MSTPEERNKNFIVGGNGGKRRDSLLLLAGAMIMAEAEISMNNLVSMDMDDFMSLPDDRKIRETKGSKGNLERVRENKYTKKIKGREGKGNWKKY